jgi:hypothetical protein
VHDDGKLPGLYLQRGRLEAAHAKGRSEAGASREGQRRM